jgi:ubiquinone/menaquinone biosynthesis C-methylase UbiE
MGTGTEVFDRLATGYDRGMQPLERLWLGSMRARLLPRAQGDVLEIGVGTGANFPFYPQSARLTAADESADMLLAAAGRAAALDRRCSFHQVDAEHLPFPTERFDAVVGTLVLCSVRDQPNALTELKRVLRRPGGRLLLLEHVRPRREILARLTDVLNIPWYSFNGRCNINRETQRAVVEAGFLLERVDTRLGGLLRVIEAVAD